MENKVSQNPDKVEKSVEESSTGSYSRIQTTEYSCRTLSDREKYLQAIEETSKIKLQLLERHETKRDAEYEIAKKEMRAMTQVLSEVDDKGKPIHSNAEKREIAQIRILEADKEYRKHQVDKDETEKSIKRLEIDLSYLLDLQRFYYAVVISTQKI